MPTSDTLLAVALRGFGEPVVEAVEVALVRRRAAPVLEAVLGPPAPPAIEDSKGMWILLGPRRHRQHRRGVYFALR